MRDTRYNKNTGNKTIQKQDNNLLHSFNFEEPVYTFPPVQGKHNFTQKHMDRQA